MARRAQVLQLNIKAANIKAANIKAANLPIDWLGRWWLRLKKFG